MEMEEVAEVDARQRKVAGKKATKISRHVDEVAVSVCAIENGRESTYWIVRLTWF